MLWRRHRPARLSAPGDTIKLVLACAFLELVVPSSYVAATDTTATTTATTTSVILPTVDVQAVNLVLKLPYDFEVIAGGLSTDHGVLDFRRIFSNGMHKTLALDEARRPDAETRAFTLTYEWFQHESKPLLQELQTRIPWSGVDEDGWLASFLVKDKNCLNIDLTKKPVLGQSSFPLKVIYPNEFDITALNSDTPRYATEITVRETDDVAYNFTVGRLITIGGGNMVHGALMPPTINTIIEVGPPVVDPTNVQPSTRTIKLGAPLDHSGSKCDPVMIKSANRVVIERIRKAVLKVPAKLDDEPLNDITIDWTQNLVTGVKKNSAFDLGNVTQGMFVFQIIDADGEVYPCTEDLFMQYINGREDFDIIFATMKAANDPKKVGTVVEFSIIDPPFGWQTPMRTAQEALLRLRSLLDEGSREAWMPPFRDYVLGSSVSVVSELTVAIHEGQFDGTYPLVAQNLRQNYAVPNGCGSCYGGYTYGGVKLLGGCAEHLAVSPGEDHEGTPWCMVFISCPDSRQGFGGDWVLCLKTDDDDGGDLKMTRTSFSRGMAPSHIATIAFVTAALQCMHRYFTVSH